MSSKWRGFVMVLATLALGTLPAAAEAANLDWLIPPLSNPCCNRPVVTARTTYMPSSVVSPIFTRPASPAPAAFVPAAASPAVIVPVPAGTYAPYGVAPCAVPAVQCAPQASYRPVVQPAPVPGQGAAYYYPNTTWATPMPAAPAFHSVPAGPAASIPSPLPGEAATVGVPAQSSPGAGGGATALRPLPAPQPERGLAPIPPAEPQPPQAQPAETVPGPAINSPMGNSSIPSLKPHPNDRTTARPVTVAARL